MEVGRSLASLIPDKIIVDFDHQIIIIPGFILHFKYLFVNCLSSDCNNILFLSRIDSKFYKRHILVNHNKKRKDRQT